MFIKMSKLQINPGQVTDVPLSVLMPDPDQPRKNYDEAPLQELADDIKLRNVREPIKIRLDESGKLIIVKGERRFRASQLALKTTIPCLLEPDEDNDENIELTRSLGQVKENHLREPLNPMEWATFLKKLRDKHGIKVSDMETFLKENAIHNMSRSYVSNLIRLVDLPEWAQDLISSGTLTAAHGKHLLAAKTSEAVMDEMKNLLDKEDLSTFTTSDMESMVIEAYREVTTVLNHSSFNHEEECKKCPKKKKFKMNWGGEVLFCLDDECYNQKQAKAAEQKTSERKTDKAAEDEAEERKPPTISKVNKKGFVDLDKHENIDCDDDMRLIEDADFNTSACESCKYNKKACGNDLDFLLGNDDGTNEIKQVCFDVECYEDKEEEHYSEQKLIAPYVSYISNCLRTHILANHFINNDELQLNILGYMALEFPYYRTGNNGLIQGCDIARSSNDDLPVILDMSNLGDILAKGIMTGVTVIARNGIEVMGEKSLAMLARHLDIKLEDILKVDKSLLELFTKEQLMTIGELANKDTTHGAAWETAIKGKSNDLHPFFKEDDFSGDNIPSIILKAWNSFTSAGAN